MRFLVLEFEDGLIPENICKQVLSGTLDATTTLMLQNLDFKINNLIQMAASQFHYIFIVTKFDLNFIVNTCYHVLPLLYMWLIPFDAFQVPVDYLVHFQFQTSICVQGFLQFPTIIFPDEKNSQVYVFGNKISDDQSVVIRTPSLFNANNDIQDIETLENYILLTHIMIPILIRRKNPFTYQFSREVVREALNMQDNFQCRRYLFGLIKLSSCPKKAQQNQDQQPQKKIRIRKRRGQNHRNNQLLVI